MFTSQSRRGVPIPVSLLVVASGLAVSGSALGQNRTWSVGSGQWGVAGNWLPADVPDSTVENAILGGASAYTVNSGATFNFGALLLTNSLAVLNIDAGTGLGISADSTNNGTITLNPAGLNQSTSLNINAAAVAINGTGSIVLNANPVNLGTAYLYFNAGGNVLTLGAGQTLRGTGDIYTNIVNNGTIQADQSGKVLELFNQNKTNNNVMKAISGGILSINSIAITQGSSGVVQANGGAVNLSSTTLTGGGLTVSGGGSASVIGTCTFNGVTLTGPLAINGSSGLAVGGTGFTSNGTITVNPTGANLSTHLDFNVAAMTLGGTGSIVLNANPANLDTAYLYFNAGGNVLTLPSTQTVQGTGNIYTNIVNNGTIQADQSGKTLQLFNQNKTNNNVMKAINGGVLAINSIAITQGSSGVIQANGGTVNLSSTTLTGGGLAISGGGSASVSGTCTFNGVTLTGSLPINAASGLALTGAGLTSNGTITINPTAANQATHMDINAAAMTLAGTGSVVLNANTANLDTAYLYYNAGGNVLTLPATQTIQGTGNVYTNFVNNGTIQADQSGKTLQLLGQNKTNNNVVKAINGGVLAISSIGVTQGSSGVIQANGGTVNLSSTTLTGGGLTVSGGGSASVSGSSTFNGVTLTGPVGLNASSVLSLPTSLTNNGTFTINATGANQSTHMDVNAPAVTIGGTGTVLLNANPANYGSAHVYYNAGGNVLTLGPGQTLMGRGQVYPHVDLQGTISPGSGPGVTDRIELFGPFVMEPTATLDIEIGGTAVGQYDRIVSNSNFTLDGLVRVRLVNGFTNPPTGTHFDIVTAANVFGSCVLTDMPKGWSLFTLPGIIRVEYSNCPADLDCGNGVGTPDSGVDINDLLYFLANYEAGLTPADLDDGSGTGTPDGGVDINDLLYFLDHYEAGC